MPFTPTPNVSKVSVVKSSSQAVEAGTPKPKSIAKRTLQDAFAEGSAKDSEALERLGVQKHERAIVELELKRCKMDHKAMKEQHQREREREQHEVRMMQMRIMMTRNHVAPAMMQPQDPASLGDYGLMAELQAPTQSSSLHANYSI
jgi:hypothetical protein